MRSLLFVPADSERKLLKAFASGADAVILDLEDAIAPEGKARARDMAASFIANLRQAEGSGPQTGTSVWVRINDLSTPFWQEDVTALARSIPDGIMLPKSRSGEDVHQLSVALGHAEEQASIETGRTKIIALATEVAVSVLQLPTYIDASHRLAALTWGAEDLSEELGASANRDVDGHFTSPFRLVRDLTLITAAAAKVGAIDTVYVDYRNPTGLALEASIAARDGFTGKLAIHPDQIPIINEAFTPAHSEIERAKAIVSAFAASPGAGAIGFEGTMLDRPHLAKARRLLQRVGHQS